MSSDALVGFATAMFTILNPIGITHNTQSICQVWILWNKRKTQIKQLCPNVLSHTGMPGESVFHPLFEHDVCVGPARF